MEGSKESGSDPRTNFRSNVFLVAALKTLEGTVPVRVRNLSATGALLEGDGLPGDAVGVLLERGQLSVHGEIAWRSGMQCGMRFDAEISVDDWVKRGGHPGQQAVDRDVASLKKTEWPSGEPATRALPVTKFHSIKSICGALDATCERLASSEEMSVKLAEEVLKLHGITQALRSMIK